MHKAILILAVICILCILTCGIIHNARQYLIADTYEYTVVSGDTLWDIACDRYAHIQGDRRIIIDDICTLNHCDGSIYAGQTLTLPIYIQEVSK